MDFEYNVRRVPGMPVQRAGNHFDSDEEAGSLCAMAAGDDAKRLISLQFSKKGYGCVTGIQP